MAEEYIKSVISDIKYLEGQGWSDQEILENINDDRYRFGGRPVTNAEIIEAFKRCGMEVKFKWGK